MSNETILDIDHAEEIPDYGRIDTQEIINLNKFLLLSVMTLGLYDIWWVFKAWRFFKQKDGLDIKPAARALFTIFFLHSLMEKIKLYSNEKKLVHYPSLILTVGFIITSFLTYLPDPYGVITSVCSVLFLIPPFNALNDAKLRSSQFKVIDLNGFNFRQICLLMVGGIVWALLIYGWVNTPSVEEIDYYLH